MRCVALGCSSCTEKDKKLAFFSVPKDVKLRKQWQTSSKRDTLKPLELNESHRFCEKHFLDTDIIRKNVFRDSTGKIVQEVSILSIKICFKNDCLFIHKEFFVGQVEQSETQKRCRTPSVSLG